MDSRPDLRAISARRQTAVYSVALADAEWKLVQAQYAQIAAGAKARLAAGQ